MRSISENFLPISNSHCVKKLYVKELSLSSDRSFVVGLCKSSPDSTEMPFMKGRAPIRRTIEYLTSGNLVLKEQIKVLSINYNTFGSHHDGARLVR